MLEDGTTHVTNGGWSSNGGQINRLRALDDRFAEYLPYDVVEITFYGKYAREGSYNDGWGLGMAGVAFDLPWTEEQIAKYLPGVELLDLTDRRLDGRGENQASAEQASIIGAGAGAYGYIPVVADLREKSSTTAKESIKARPGSELFERTAMEVDRRRAAAEAAKT